MGVLDGIKVVELAEHGFVPSCGAILGDWGAEVVKVERPTGDPLRAIMSAGFVADTGDFNFLWELYNRNKRGIALDLRVPEGRDAFDRLIEPADVFITNFLPSARAKLRTNPEDLFAINPRLVYAKGHGQGQRGPDADAGGFDAVSYWSRGGVGHILSPAGGPMVMQRGAMGDAPSGAMLAGGIAAALFQRERTGKGSVVDTALLNFAVWQLGVDLTATTILREEPAKMTAGVGTRESARRPVRDERRPLPDPQHARRRPPLGAACRALGLDTLIDDPRYVDTAARAANAVELHAGDHRGHRVAHARRRPHEVEGRGHDLLRAAVAARGHRRRAGGGERVPGSAPHASHRPCRRRADAVRRRAHHDPRGGTRDRRAHR